MSTIQNQLFMVWYVFILPVTHDMKIEKYEHMYDYYDCTVMQINYWEWVTTVAAVGDGCGGLGYGSTEDRILVK